MGNDQYGFCIGLLRSRNQYNSIWVIMDKMTKCAHFLHMSTTYSGEDYIKLFIQEIVKLHGAPVPITSDRGWDALLIYSVRLRKGMVHR